MSAMLALAIRLVAGMHLINGGRISRFRLLGVLTHGSHSA